MELQSLYSLYNNLLGDISTFQGLMFNLPHGFLVVDFVIGHEYPLNDGTVDVVDGYVMDFVPYDELQEPITYFALDIEGVKYIISDFILE